MLRRRGEPGFASSSWDEALDRIAAELRAVDPQRAAFYLTSRGITNEVYYAAQKAARFLGSQSRRQLGAPVSRRVDRRR